MFLLQLLLWNWTCWMIQWNGTACEGAWRHTCIQVTISVHNLPLVAAEVWQLQHHRPQTPALQTLQIQMHT
jgi:hypothetical protein